VKVEAAGPPDTLISFYQTLHCHVQNTVVLIYTNIEFLFRHALSTAALSVECLLPPDHPVTAALLRHMVKGMPV